MPPLPRIAVTASPVQRHVEMLHHVAEGLRGVLVVSVFNANLPGDRGTITHHPIGATAGMVDAIEAHQGVPGVNVYVGLQVMRPGLGRGKRGSESDILAVLGLVADMDSDTGKVGPIPYPPSYVVETSPGNRQPAWLFDRPLAPAEAKPLAAALRRATQSDAGTADITHVWRVPGTANWPNAKKLARGRSAEPFDVDYAEEWDGSLVDVDAFRAALEPWAKAPANENHVTLGDVPDVAGIAVGPTIAEMLVADGQPDRSAHAARLVEAMSFAGHTAEEGLALFLAAEGEWTGRYKDDAAQRRDFERLWSRFGVRHEEDLTPWLPTKLLAKLADTKADTGTAPEPKSGATSTPNGSQQSATTSATQPAIYATPFEWIDPRHLPRREFLYGTHLIRKYVSVTVSPGGLGKTSLTIAEAIAMVSNKPLLGTKPARKLNVWLWNAEDPRDEMERRIMAAAMHYKLKPASLAGLFLDTGREQDLVIAYDDKRGVKIATPIIEAVIAQIRDRQIDVMVIDPFVSTHSVSENDNGAIDKVTKLWARIADETNCAIELVHHVRKSEGRDITVEDARGAVSLLAAARSARVLNRMTEEQASQAGVPVQDRYGYFSVTRGKANLAPMSGHQEWRHLVSVPLGNGQGLTRPQDHAGVVTEWQWPDKDAMAATIPEGVKRDVLTKLANQDCRESPQSDQWAGYVLAKAMGMHVETGRAMTAEKRKAKNVLDSWIENGILVVSDEPDPKHVGRGIKFIRPAAPHLEK